MPEGMYCWPQAMSAKGTTMLVADYNQIELRCIAHLAADPGLIDAFTSGRDIHNATAARVFDVDPDEVALDQRSKAKMVSYGLAYGMEAYGLAQRLNIPVDEAAPILDAYFVAFPNVKAYMDATVQEARKVRIELGAIQFVLLQPLQQRGSESEACECLHCRSLIGVVTKNSGGFSL